MPDHKFRIILHKMPEGQSCGPCEESERVIKEAIADHDIEFIPVTPESSEEAIAPYAPVILIQTNCGSQRIEGGVNREQLEAVLESVSCDAIRKELWAIAQKKVEALEKKAPTECEIPPK